MDNITSEDLKSFKKCLAVADISKITKVDYSFICIGKGRISGTDGIVQVSYPTDIKGDYPIHKTQADIIVKLGVGELEIDKYNIGMLIYVADSGVYGFKPHIKPRVKLLSPFENDTIAGFNVPIADMLMAITSLQSSIKNKPLLMYIEACESLQEVHLFGTDESKDWDYVIPAKVMGNALAILDCAQFSRILTYIPNRKLKFIISDGDKPCVLNNDYAIAQFTPDLKSDLIKMKHVFPTINNIIND